MILAAELGFNRRWQIVGTDISTRVLETARRAVYPSTAIDKIPKQYLRDYCLKGVRSQQGTIMMDKSIRNRVDFKSLNLNGNWPTMEKFDIIFLRNVMIYFDIQTKRLLIEKLANMLKPKGYFIIGHSETLNSVSNRFEAVYPSVYQLAG
jgi:chemotaxis protein methyltransferase CheR